MAPRDRARFGKLVYARRKELKLRQADIQAAGGPSTATLREIEHGTQKSNWADTFRKLDEVLFWAPGSSERILEGGDPEPMPVYPPRYSDPALQRIWEIDILPRHVRLELIDRVKDMRESNGTTERKDA